MHRFSQVSIRDHLDPQSSGQSRIAKSEAVVVAIRTALAKRVKLIVVNTVVSVGRMFVIEFSFVEF